jgi:hypothetical protein
MRSSVFSISSEGEASRGAESGTAEGGMGESGQAIKRERK